MQGIGDWALDTGHWTLDFASEALRLQQFPTVLPFIIKCPGLETNFSACYPNG